MDPLNCATPQVNGPQTFASFIPPTSPGQAIQTEMGTFPPHSKPKEIGSLVPRFQVIRSYPYSASIRNIRWHKF